MVEDSKPTSDTVKTNDAAVHHVVEVVDVLGRRVVGLLGWIIALTFFVFMLFTAAYFTRCSS